MQWQDVLADPSLRDLPYKIELNERGRIEMSPATNRHGILQSRLVRLMARFLPEGESITECAIQTTSGVKVVDVAWGSKAFFQRQSLKQDPFEYAPDICVEIVSPGNSTVEMEQKIAAYLQQGVLEVWLVDLQGNCRFFNQGGAQKETAFRIPERAWGRLGQDMLF
uniref:Endonuclease, Uma2 family (Restriction endonuclease fold) n=1 Tax=Candidatus Kentrum sp. FM TaxID=2126340 RepID=A0A450VP46_9GAMM|nr:MAG: Endonuclease, Uma2 family (restriction endonuclease fold) [Candidatus Kentron sp. FM]VFJ44570.1 MAG: Endonuclease, Uma2 family (restriction endonuclease fold) [Candidatus Kentron sp. FM]VFK06540.1 MAG: Endonuclease, Uma2 family (restriction endonuclease fold) [Candidatus Kentron sp. FM]